MSVDESKKNSNESLAALLPHDATSVRIMNERAAILAQVPDDKINERKDTVEYIKFILGDHESYGMSYQDILDVKPNEHITRVPHVPEFVLGISYWHGKLIAVIDLGSYFGIRHNHACVARPYIATIAYKKSIIGLAFDEVVGVDVYHENNLDKGLAANPNIADSYVRGIHHGKTVILNIQPILTDISAQLMKERGRSHE